MPGDEHGDEVGGRHGGRRVPRAGGRAAPDRVDAKLLPQLPSELEVGTGECLSGCHVSPYHKQVVDTPEATGVSLSGHNGRASPATSNRRVLCRSSAFGQPDAWGAAAARRSTSVTIPSRILSPASQKPGSVMSMPRRLTSSSGRVEPPAARNSRYSSTKL